MSIEYAILGFLSWQPQTGYELKKRFAESVTMYWSGNNNQIYRALIDLHRQELVSLEVEQQESRPPRKTYSITVAGRRALREWLLATPELPQHRNGFLVQLAWADQLSPAELDAQLAAYEEEIRVQLLMLKEGAGRAQAGPGRTPREELLWSAISDNWAGMYRQELDWVRGLRQSSRALAG
jgi:PadR family transcriptional regulator, regulatory protein AphA